MNLRKNTVAAAFGLTLLFVIQSVQGADKEENSSPEKITVINKGVGGSNTENALRRLNKDVLEIKPTHLIIYFGMNDALNSACLIPPEKYEANLQSIIDAAKQNGIKNIVLVTLNPIISTYVRKRHPAHPAQNLDEYLLKYNKIIMGVAEKNKLPIADLRKLVDSKGGATEDKSSLLRNTANSKSEDGVHLTAEGYNLLAELIFSILKDQVKEGDTVLCFGDSLTYGVYMKGVGTACGDTYPGKLADLLNKKK